MPKNVQHTPHTPPCWTLPLSWIRVNKLEHGQAAGAVQSDGAHKRSIFYKKQVINDLKAIKSDHNSV